MLLLKSVSMTVMSHKLKHPKSLVSRSYFNNLFCKQRKHYNSTLLTPWSPHKGPVMWKAFPYHTIIMRCCQVGGCVGGVWVRCFLRTIETWSNTAGKYVCIACWDATKYIKKELWKWKLVSAIQPYLHGVEILWIMAKVIYQDFKKMTSIAKLLLMG